jgi:lauroyl/myristoyl acyltransferase
VLASPEPTAQVSGTVMQRAAPWARALNRAPNAKFAATAHAYVHAGLADSESVHALVDANVDFTYRYYCRLARMRFARQRRILDASVDGSSAEALRAALPRGRGIVLVSVHLGDFDVAGAWLARSLDREVVVTVDPLAQPLRQAWFEGVRRASGMLLRRRAETRLSDLEADLRRGRIVLWMLDRAAPGPIVPVTMLGRSTGLSAAPVALARRTGAAVICGTTTTTSGGTRRLHLAPSLSMESANHSARSALNVLAAILGAQIPACPWQWHVPANLGELSINVAASAAQAAHSGPIRVPPRDDWAPVRHRA